MVVLFPNNGFNTFVVLVIETFVYFGYNTKEDSPVCR